MVFDYYYLQFSVLSSPNYQKAAVVFDYYYLQFSVVWLLAYSESMFFQARHLRRPPFFDYFDVPSLTVVLWSDE